MRVKENVKIYTDGSCHGNPGPGGYAAVLQRADGSSVTVHGAEWYTTNNRMELTAVIEGLKLVTSPSTVTIFTDSKYVADLINRSDLKYFIKNPQKKNTDLIRRIISLSDGHSVHANWIRGHAGNALNERCDKLANSEVDRLEKERSIRRFVIASILKDALVTPEDIADRYPGIVSLDTVKKYYDHYFKMQEDCYVTGRQE